MTTQTFTLRTLLTVTTGRLLTEPEGARDNGIGRMYKLLGWMTSDEPFTHQLGRFADECKPWLLRWFPELAPASGALTSLDRWIKSERTDGGEGIKMWIAELQMMYPDIKSEYAVPKIPADDHEHKNPFDELVQMRGTDEGIVIASSK